jgi:hypothetical protein
MLSKATKPELATRRRGAATLARGDVGTPKGTKSLSDVQGSQYAESTQGIERGILMQWAVDAGLPVKADMSHGELTRVLGDARMLTPVFGNPPRGRFNPPAGRPGYVPPAPQPPVY